MTPDELASAVPGRELRDLGVVLAEGSDPDPLEWRFVVDGPIVLMSSATGMDGRGFRYLVGVWPGEHAFVAVSLVKLYATGGREGVMGVLHRGTDLEETLTRVNDVVALNEESPRLARGFQPAGSAKLDLPQVLATLGRGECFTGPGWDEVDAAAIRGYGGKRPEHWPPPGTPCAMKYERGPA